jgi:hypothetical protein
MGDVVDMDVAFRDFRQRRAGGFEAGPHVVQHDFRLAFDTGGQHVSGLAERWEARNENEVADADRR